MRRHACTTALLLCVFAALPLGAQERAPVSAGDRVRVEVRGDTSGTGAAGARVEGHYLSGFGATLLLAREGADTVRVPMASVLEMKVADGERRRFLHDLLVGATAGALLGFAAGIPERNDQVVSDPGGFLLWTATAGAILGGVVGLAVAVKPRTHWKRVWPER